MVCKSVYGYYLKVLIFRTKNTSKSGLIVRNYSVCISYMLASSYRFLRLTVELKRATLKKNQKKNVDGLPAVSNLLTPALIKVIHYKFY